MASQQGKSAQAPAAAPPAAVAIAPPAPAVQAPTPPKKTPAAAAFAPSFLAPKASTRKEKKSAAVAFAFAGEYDDDEEGIVSSRSFHSTPNTARQAPCSTFCVGGQVHPSLLPKDGGVASAVASGVCPNACALPHTLARRRQQRSDP
jgi:hypothetical protein